MNRSARYERKWWIESEGTGGGGEIGDRFQKSISGSEDMCREPVLFKAQDPGASGRRDYLRQRDLMQVPTTQVLVSLRIFIAPKRIMS